MKGNNENYKKWANDEEYRKKVIRDIEEKYNLNLDGATFYNLVR